MTDQTTADWDPLAERPPCARCKGEKCMPECEYGLANFICPRDVVTLTDGAVVPRPAVDMAVGWIARDLKMGCDT